MKAKERVLNAIIYIFLISLLIITLVPIIYTIAGSFKPNAEILAHPERMFPSEPTLDNYKVAFTARNFNIPRMFWNSTWYTVLSVVITLTLSTLSGYVFARGGIFPGSKFIFAMFSASMFFNMGGITIYPIFKILSTINMSDSLWGLVIKKFFGVGIVNIYLVRGYIRQLPKELDEAAEVDGCGFVGIFFRIIFPLLKPLIATLTILAFNGAWNDYYEPTLFTITRPEQRTLIVGISQLKNSGSAAANWNLMLAGATITIVPILIVYSFCNRYFIEGITAGAVKG